LAWEKCGKRNGFVVNNGPQVTTQGSKGADEGKGGLSAWKKGRRVLGSVVIL